MGMSVLHVYPLPACLPVPAYPTPMYEVILAFIIFLILWSFRKKIKLPGMIFGIYLMFNGLERFCIELIRVNSKYTVAGIPFTQAELISSILFICGAILVVFAIKNKEKHANY